MIPPAPTGCSTIQTTRIWAIARIHRTASTFVHFSASNPCPSTQRRRISFIWTFGQADQIAPELPTPKECESGCLGRGNYTNYWRDNSAWDYPTQLQNQFPLYPLTYYTSNVTKYDCTSLTTVWTDIPCSSLNTMATCVCMMRMPNYGTA
ncbi:unnamed protein product, partial [Mesorhabditis spiculigera]